MVTSPDDRTLDEAALYKARLANVERDRLLDEIASAERNRDTWQRELAVELEKSQGQRDRLLAENARLDTQNVGLQAETMAYAARVAALTALIETGDALAAAVEIAEHSRRISVDAHDVQVWDAILDAARAWRETRG